MKRVTFPDPSYFRLDLLQDVLFGHMSLNHKKHTPKEVSLPQSSSLKWKAAEQGDRMTKYLIEKTYTHRKIYLNFLTYDRKGLQMRISDD